MVSNYILVQGTPENLSIPSQKIWSVSLGRFFIKLQIVMLLT